MIVANSGQLHCQRQCHTPSLVVRASQFKVFLVERELCALNDLPMFCVKGEDKEVTGTFSYWPSSTCLVFLFFMFLKTFLSFCIFHGEPYV